MKRGARARAGSLAAAIAVVAIACTNACTQNTRLAAGTQAERAKRGATESGPIATIVPPGVVVAQTSQQLARWLADPQGPTEIWLGAHRYDGDFSVRRKVALRGARGALLHGSGRGTVLSIEADDVLIDNLIIRHSGQRHTTEDAGIKAKGKAIRIRNVRVEDTLFGISLGPCPRCEVEHTHVQGPGDQDELKGDGIKLWESDDAVVRNCTVDAVRDVVVWYSRRVLLEGNAVRHSRYGTHFMYAHDSIVRNSHIEDNVVGIFVMYSSRLHVERNVLAGARGAAGVGVGFKESDEVRVFDNWIVANTTGSYLDETPRSFHRPVVFSGNRFALNDVALRFHGVQAGLTFRANEFRQNTVLADVEGGGDALAIVFSHNYFSDYAGYDLDGDGVGDVAFQVKRLSGELVDAHPALAFFEGTVAMGLLDAIATAVPVFASRLLLEDKQPMLAALPPP